MDRKRKICLLLAALLATGTVCAAAQGGNVMLCADAGNVSHTAAQTAAQSGAQDGTQDGAQTAAQMEAEANLEKQTTVPVYDHIAGRTVRMELEEYLQGVVVAEMPVSYGIEALKAQAVAARTLVYYHQSIGRRHAGGALVCTDYHCCQAWRSAADCGGAYPEKVRQAVAETRGVIVTYEGEPINAMYFSASGGFTENFDDVWGGEAPCAYLQSVSSANEGAYGLSETVQVVEFSPWIMLVRLRNAGIWPNCVSTALLASVTDIERSESGRVKTLTIGGVRTTGTAVRAALGLRSTNFYLEELSDGRIAIVTIGYGHGVGMSQCGAGAMAEEGHSYEDILHHYYTDITVERRSSLPTLL